MFTRYVFLMQQANSWELTDKFALISVENRFNLIVFNSAT